MAALLALASLLASACGGIAPTAAGPLVVTGPLPGGQIMTLTIDDRTGLVEGVSFALPDPDYLKDQEGGIALKNVAGDPSRLRVSWEGGICSPTKVDMTIERTGSGFSLAVSEPQPCSEQAARQKTIDLDLSSALLAASVEGTWMPR